MLNKIIIRVAGLIALMFILNIIYKYTVYKKDMYDVCEQVLEMNEQQDSTDIYYLAESSNYNSVPSDSISSSISQLTNLFFPGLKVLGVSKPAAHGGVFRHWLTGIDPDRKKPKAIVVTLNLRSFDAAWINNVSENHMQQSIVLLRPYPKLLNRFLLSLNVYDIKQAEQHEQVMLDEWRYIPLTFPYESKWQTVRQWDDAFAGGAGLKPGEPWDDKKIALACHYIKGFAFNITDANPRIKDYDFIADWCNKNDVQLYLNLMAENMDFSDSLVGKDLVFLMKNNRDYLVKRYNKNNCEVVDNLELVPGTEFTDHTWTTEHYSDKGRMIIARNLAGKIKNKLNNFYKKAY